MAHRRSQSTPTRVNDLGLEPSSTRTSRTASRFMSSVRRSFTPTNKPNQNLSLLAMRSTPEESQPLPLPQFRVPLYSSSPPTIEQIAMGLHISRTPHLRPPRHSQSMPPNIRRSSSTPMPPPPRRSSLKQPANTLTSSISTPPFSSASASSTTITSINPPTPRSASGRSSPFSFPKFRMSHFLPGTRSSSAPSSPNTSRRNSMADLPQKKAVRFSRVGENDDDQSDDD
ncbi:hypothetical protein K443DRAFT_671928 [Laccaria amethystina LaAM-08-1]|uniref:Uncharacterized protein n=1 Tax=Laccaria amethystina LaAM-08-1 TaxID=1095629 RepID=A0A0C9XV15_9AGAR|nr:hypothetical protein K443DRAFT_671928 [Laccaria amethystina LaAM-08-1]